jgi:uncharacterized LabA/DUF88 family protein
MSRGRIAILIDGAFLLERLPKILAPSKIESPKAVSYIIRRICRTHVKVLTGDDDVRWHRHVYRIFYYDALPYNGKAHHPVLNRPIDFGNSDVARFRLELFERLREHRKLALRLGKVVRDGDWSLARARVKKLLATREWFKELDLNNDEGHVLLKQQELIEARRLQAMWCEIEAHHVALDLRQKGVDMRIGLDIASISLKRQAETLVLVAGDSDFVPAAKLARREGMEFILDPLWQRVNPDLFEHIDGLQSGLPKPGSLTAAEADEEAKQAGE